MRCLIRALVAVATLASGGCAPSDFRCTGVDGRTGYQSQPCADGGRQSEVKIAPAPPPDAAPRKSMWKSVGPERVAAVTFYYDSVEQPVGFSTEQMEASIRTAMAMWSKGCNV